LGLLLFFPPSVGPSPLLERILRLWGEEHLLLTFGPVNPRGSGVRRGGAIRGNIIESKPFLDSNVNKKNN
jgi:hypothetical protein